MCYLISAGEQNSNDEIIAARHGPTKNFLSSWSSFPVSSASSARSFTPVQLVLVTNLLGNYNKSAMAMDGQLDISNYTDYVRKKMLCIPHRASEKVVMFIRNYYDCDTFMIQEGHLSKSALQAYDLKVSYFAEKSDLFHKCPYVNRVIYNNMYTFMNFFNVHEGITGSRNLDALLYAKSNVFDLHTTEFFNVVLVKIDADINEWESWINNILFVYKLQYAKPTLAILLGDINEAISTAFTMSLVNEIINSGQIIGIIETDESVDTTKYPSDSWKNIIWETLNYTEITTHLFIEGINSTNFNLIINKKKYGFFMDPLHKLKCTYPLCYLDCDEAAKYDGYCLRNVTNLGAATSTTTTTITTTTTPPLSLAPGTMSTSSEYGKPSVYRHWVVPYKKFRPQDEDYNIEYNPFTRKSLGMASGRRTTTNEDGPSYMRFRRNAISYDVTSMPLIETSYNDNLRNTLEYPEWFKFWLKIRYNNETFNKLLDDTFEDNVVIIQNPAKYFVMNTLDMDYHLLDNGILRPFITFNNQSVSLFNMVACYHGIVETVNKKNINEPAQCLRYNLRRLIYIDGEYKNDDDDDCDEISLGPADGEEPTTSTETSSTTTTTTTTTTTSTAAENSKDEK